MLYVLVGPDQFRAREELNAIKRGLDRDGNLVHNTARLEARGLSPADLRSACLTASFFAEDRLVIVEGLQGRFSGQRRRSRGRREAASGGGSDFDELVAVLSDLPETTTVALLDEQESTAFTEAIEGKAKVLRFPVLRFAELRQWASERVKAQGASISPPALERLTSLIDGHHLGELAQEIDKLATYTAGRRIEVPDIDALVSGAVQYQVWDLTDAVIEGRGDRALAVLRAMDARDFAPQMLIFMLTRQYRQLLLAQALLKAGLNAEQLGAQLRLSGFPLRKIIDQSSRYPAERLEGAYRRLLETDVAVKTGVLEVDMALELLIVDLAELARSPRRIPARR